MAGDEPVAPRDGVTAKLSTSRDAVDLVQLKQDYEAGELPLSNIYVEYGIGSRALQSFVVSQGWRKRRPRAVDRSGVIARLFHLLERKIAYLEKDMDEKNAAEAAELSRMVASLDKLIAIEDAELHKRSRSKAPSKAMVEIRARVAERLAQLGGD